MSTWGSVRRLYFALLALAGICLWLNASEAEEPQKEKDGKVIQIDLSKLPPDLAKKLEAYIGKKDEKKEEQKGFKGKGKGFGDKKDFFKGKKGFDKKDFFKKEAGEKKAPEGKALTLGQAIALVEKLSKGEAIRADRKGEGKNAHYHIEVVDGLGTRTVHLDATGQVVKGGGAGFFPKGEFKKGGFPFEFKKGDGQKGAFKKFEGWKKKKGFGTEENED